MSQQLVLNCEAVETVLPNGHYRIEVKTPDCFGSKTLITFERASEDSAKRDLCDYGFDWVELIEDLNDIRDEPFDSTRILEWTNQ